MIKKRKALSRGFFARKKNMNHKILKTLEFEKIVAQLADLTTTGAGRELALQLQPESNVNDIQLMLDQTWALTNLERLKGRLPLADFADIKPALRRLAVHAALSATELGNLRLVLAIADEINSFVKDSDADLQAVAPLLADLAVPTELYQRLRRTVEFDGTVLDTASDKLSEIRTAIAKNNTEIKTRMNGYLSGNSAKYLSENIVTIRAGRYVLPVMQQYRGKFGGVVHDQSASGQTLFIEPAVIVNLNNRQQNLLADEKQEISRILKRLSALAGDHSAKLDQIATAIARLDFITAKSRLGKNMHASVPKLAPDNRIVLRQARHPLIDPQKVVANDIELGTDFDTMLITGPNTGGKTITLKTVGLLQLMAQAGLLIPAQEGSSVGIFDQIFADIGDEQSIEQSLSTFSSHIDNIVAIMKKADRRSLILIDELGAGTDPEEGASLAIAILDSLRAKDCKIMVTTHYPELKLYGYNRERTINASMEFDLHTLSPTYRLQIGIPGQSNAFAIAKRLGMDSAVVDQAQSLMSDEDSDLNHMIERLNEQTRLAAKHRRELAKAASEAEVLAKQLQDGLDIFRQKEKRMLDAANERASQIVAKKRQQADQIISDLQKENLQTNNVIAAKGRFNKLEQEAENLAHNKVLKQARKRHHVKVGDRVKVLSYGQTGVITSKLSDHNFEVQIGILKVKVSDREVEKISADSGQSPKKTRAVRSSRGLRRSSVRGELDLRGERYDEAMTDLDRYIDAALLAGLSTVTIIHGIGTGAIRTGVWKYLRASKHAKSFNYAPANQGGNGATIVQLQ